MPTRKPPTRVETEPPVRPEPPRATTPPAGDDLLAACYAELAVLRDFLQALAINPAVPPGIKVEINRRTAATGLVITAAREKLKGGRKR